jgi:hypothetical protein
VWSVVNRSRQVTRGSTWLHGLRCVDVLAVRDQAGRILAGIPSGGHPEVVESAVTDHGSQSRLVHEQRSVEHGNAASSRKVVPITRENTRYLELSLHAVKRKTLSVVPVMGRRVETCGPAAFADPYAGSNTLWSKFDPYEQGWLAPLVPGCQIPGTCSRVAYGPADHSRGMKMAAPTCGDTDRAIARGYFQTRLDRFRDGATEDEERQLPISPRRLASPMHAISQSGATATQRRTRGRSPGLP